MELNPNTNIYTRESPNQQSKAKLDHILMNEPAYNITSDAGWITTNPFIISDHGIIWVALNKNKLNLLKQQPTKTKKNKQKRQH